MMAKVSVHEEHPTPSIGCVPVNLVAFPKHNCSSFCSSSSQCTALLQHVNSNMASQMDTQHFGFAVIGLAVKYC